MLSKNEIIGYNWQTHEEYSKKEFLPVKEKTRILITSGASCPDAIVEKVIEKLVSFYPGAEEFEKIKSSWT